MKNTRSRQAVFPPFGQAPTEYSALCALHLPRPIHSVADARSATQVVQALAGHDLNRDQEDYLEAVGHFLDEFDRANRPQLPSADGLSVLRGLLEDRGQTGADLSRILGGSRNLGAMILKGDRRLTADHIRVLASHFGVSPSVFF